MDIGIKIFEDEHTVLYRGFNKEIIDLHLNTEKNKMIFVFDTCENFLKQEINYNSMLLAMYQIYENTTNDWIIDFYNNVLNIKKIKNSPWNIYGK